MRKTKPGIYGYILTGAATLLLLGVIFEVGFLDNSLTLFVALFIIWLGSIMQRKEGAAKRKDDGSSS